VAGVDNTVYTFTNIIILMKEKDIFDTLFSILFRFASFFIFCLFAWVIINPDNEFELWTRLLLGVIWVCVLGIVSFWQGWFDECCTCEFGYSPVAESSDENLLGKPKFGARVSRF